MLSQSLDDTLLIGEKVGLQLKGGEVIELSGDVGSGKTVFVRGLAKGAGSKDNVSSPSFTISRVYKADGFDIHHFDFYRLADPGIMKADIAEAAEDETSVVAVEWSDVIEEVLPEDRIVVNFTSVDEESRKIAITFPEEKDDTDD